MHVSSLLSLLLSLLSLLSLGVCSVCSGAAVPVTARPSGAAVPVPTGQDFALSCGGVALAGEPFACVVTLAPFKCFDSSIIGAHSGGREGRNNGTAQAKCLPWPRDVRFSASVPSKSSSRANASAELFSAVLRNVTSSAAGLANGLTFTVSGLTVSALGPQLLNVALVMDEAQPTTGERMTTTTTTVSCSFHVIPPILSIMPPIVTLILAVATKQVVPSLLVGVWVGALFVDGFNPIASFCNTFSVYFVDALTGNGHGPVILIACVLGGVLELVDKSGGAKGLAMVARKMASTRQRALVAAYVLSIFIFFDDYSCILIVGACLRPSLKQVRVSPAKLAFIIHIVGNNLPSFFPVSSWVGVELGYIKGQYDALGMTESHGAFSVFLRTIPYRFFPLVAILMPLLSILTQRDFGPLLDAEVAFLRENPAAGRSGDGAHTAHGSEGAQRGETEEGRHGKVEEALLCVNGSSNTLVGGSESSPMDVPLLIASGGTGGNGGNGVGGSSCTTPKVNADAATSLPARWANAVVPFSVLIVATFVGIIVSGSSACTSLGLAHPSLVDVVAHADSVDALLWAAAAASAVCILLYACQRLMTLEEMMGAWTTGFKDMMEPLLILMLAWALGGVVEDLKTSSFLAGALGGNLRAVWLAPLATLLAGIVSFASGSAMGTMGILFPLVLPLASSLALAEAGKSPSEIESSVMQAAAAVLAGATFGNTCSPIADNTILSSLSTGCDLVLHAKTMAPYTALAFVVSLVFGTVPVSLGWYGAGIGMLACCCVLVVVLFVAGKNPQIAAVRPQLPTM